MPSDSLPESRGVLLPARKVIERYQITSMSLWRWLRAEELAFPRPIVIRGRRYFYEDELERWERARVAG